MVKNLKKKEVVDKKEKISNVLNMLAIFALVTLVAFVFVKFSVSLTGNAIEGNPANKGIYGPEALLQGIGDVFMKVIEFAKPTWEAVIGQTSEQVFLSKIMFLLLVFGVTWFILGKIEAIGKNKGFHLFLSIVFGILFTRWIVTDDIVKTVIMPYNVVGAALSAFVPLGVVFYITFILLGKKEYSIIRKLIWIFVMAYFIVAWSVAYKDIANMKNPEWIWTYPIAAGLALLMVLFDRSLMLYFLDERIKTVGEKQRELTELKYLREIASLEKDASDGIISQKVAEAKIKKIQDELKILNKRRTGNTLA